MLVFVSVLLGVAFFLMMLSYLPWAQANMSWITDFKFFVVVGILVGAGIIYLLYRLGSLLMMEYSI